jgi:hypothetical protein
MGANIPEVNETSHLFNFNAVSQNSKYIEAYQANTRVDANRFGQMGIYWSKGLSDPMIVDGITAWGIPLQREAR